MAQVTSVSELSDVQPTDWAFQALQSLVERYGCIAGYPDGTYRLDRALTRGEFAAGLNACLDRILELSQTGEAGLSAEELATLNRLSQEFAAELSVVRGRVDTLEGRLSTLEAQQFSTTTKMTGEVIFAPSVVFGNERADGTGQDVQDNVILTHRTYVFLNTSFSGSDRLSMRLQAANTPDFVEASGTGMTRLSFANDTDNSFTLGELGYTFPLGDRGAVYMGAFGAAFDIFAPTINYLDGEADASITAFGSRNYIYRLSGLAGIGLTYDITDAITIDVGYLAGDAANRRASDVRSGAGLFNGPYGAIAQLRFRPLEDVELGLTYVNAYNIDTAGGIGSRFANDPFNGGATIANTYGVEARAALSPNFNISSWVGFGYAQSLSGLNQGAKARIFSWGLGLGFPDLGGEGNLGGLIVGQPPRTTFNSVESREDPDTSLHFEAFYRYQLNDNIGITPGFAIITNPEHNSDNDTLYLGTIRTTFRF